jgi:opacity protein-like surface antigen
MIKKIVIIGLAIFSVSAFAAPQVQSSQQSGIKPYIGGLIGSGTYTGSNAFNSFSEGTGMNFQLNGGVMFNKYIGVEAFYSNNGSFKVPVSDASISNSSYGINVKGVIPFENNPFSLYGKLGFGTMTQTADSQSADVSGISFALGAAYNFLPNLAGTLEYNSITGSDNLVDYTFSMFGIGLNYSF